MISLFTCAEAIVLTRTTRNNGGYMRVAALLCALSVPGAAFAAQSTQAAYIEGYCSGAEQDLQAVVASIQYIDEALPQIPPEEERYFKREYAALMGPMSWSGDAATKAVFAQRFDELQKRRLFYVWQVRKELPQVAFEVEAVERPALEFEAFMEGKFKGAPPSNAYADERANRLNRALRASSALSDLAIRMADLLDRNSIKPLFSGQQFQILAFRTGMLVSNMNQYAECQLAKVAPVKGASNASR
jgi:hypothetical protein